MDYTKHSYVVLCTVGTSVHTWDKTQRWFVFNSFILIGRSVVDNHQNEVQNNVIEKFSQPKQPKILKIGIFEGILAKYQCFQVHFLVRFGQIFSHDHLIYI